MQDALPWLTPRDPTLRQWLVLPVLRSALSPDLARDITHGDFHSCGFWFFEVTPALWGKVIRGLYRIISPKGYEDMAHDPSEVARRWIM